MNVILVSLDTTRADRLSCYGYPRPTSPHIDRIARDGATLLDFHSPHIPTYPGHTTMMTGRDVYAHRVTGQSSALEPTPGIAMLAEILRDSGYLTAAADTLGHWFARGFDVYRGYEWQKARYWRAAEAVTEVALDLLREVARSDRPFFLFLHYWDAHTPYVPPPPFDRMFYAGDEKDPRVQTMAPVWRCEAFKWYFHEWMPGVTDIEFPRAQYDAEIAYMDACLAHVFSALDDLDLTQNTLLVLTADHGEELDEHGCWFDHHGLYETNTHIPLILRLPGTIPAGLRLRGSAALMDLVPTVLDLLGVKPKNLTFDGASLRPALDGHVAEGDQPPFRRVLHMTENTWMKKRAVRTADWKLIVALEPDLHGFPPVELYNLAEDPGEKVNRAEDCPDIVEELIAVMTQHVEDRCRRVGLPDPLPLHPIPLRSIGRPPAAGEAAATGGDERLPDGDFVGYAREGGRP